MNKTLLWWPG